DEDWLSWVLRTSIVDGDLESLERRATAIEHVEPRQVERTLHIDHRDPAGERLLPRSQALLSNDARAGLFLGKLDRQHDRRAPMLGVLAAHLERQARLARAGSADHHHRGADADAREQLAAYGEIDPRIRRARQDGSDELRRTLVGLACGFLGISGRLRAALLELVLVGESARVQT